MAARGVSTLEPVETVLPVIPKVDIDLYIAIATRIEHKNMGKAEVIVI